MTKLLLYRFGFLLLLFPLAGSFSSVSGQSMEFMIFECKGCSLDVQKTDRKQLEQMIAKETNVETAANKIKGYFRTLMGDRFMLNCEGCKGRKTYYYPPPISLVSSPGRSGESILGIKGRGVDEHVYSFNDYIRLLQNTLLIFDSLVLDLTKLANRNDDVLGSFAVSYNYRGKSITRPLGYNEKEKTVTLTYKNFFGNVLARTVTDSLPVKVFYMNSQGKEVMVSTNFGYYFASATEKKELNDLFTIYKEKFPSWQTDQIVDELIPVVEQRYNNVNKSNFMKWLKTQN